MKKKNKLKKIKWKGKKKERNKRKQWNGKD